MLRKRVICVFLAILSFFVFIQSAHAVSLKNIFDGKKAETKEESSAKMKLYLPTAKAEPASVLKVVNGDKYIVKGLYDGNLDTNVSFDKDAEITIDMGRNIMLSQMRYYAGELDEKNGNNCLGTRFYASTDNRKFVELAVLEQDVTPENNWYDINFSGFGEYRYFKINIPEKSNIAEVEWFSAEAFSCVRRGNGNYDVSLNLYGFDVRESFDAKVVLASYNANGAIKAVSVLSRRFEVEQAESFVAELKNIDVENGDSYRVIVFDEEGLIAIEKPLNYRANGASSDFKVSSVFSDNMIIQAEKPFIVWGSAQRGSNVEVELINDLGGGIKAEAKTDADSKWEINLGTFSAGGSYTMIVRCANTKVEYKNITFGDVWICTGQSNMEYYMAACSDTAKELKKPDIVRNSNIRLFNLFDKGMTGAALPLDNPPYSGGWQEFNSDTVAYCSAVGYYFAKDIYEASKLPVGIINVAVGDTEINRWIPKGDVYGEFVATDGDLYNNRIKPFEKLAIKGIILYQGEADQYRTHLSEDVYSDAMAGLVDKYRRNWGEDLPFYWAQLTRYRVDEAIIREGQRMSLDKVSVKANTGMIVLNDLIGNYNAKTGSCRNDIHPWDKKTVAERFSAYAKRDCYGQNIAVSGPVYKSLETRDNSLILTFECDGKLRVMPKERYADKITDKKIKKDKIDTSKPMEFEIAGEDGEFYPATAVLDGKNAILTCEKVEKPLYARYAWGAYPEMPNLTDDTGLPAATFDTRN